MSVMTANEFETWLAKIGKTKEQYFADQKEIYEKQLQWRTEDLREKLGKASDEIRKFAATLMREAAHETETANNPHRAQYVYEKTGYIWGHVDWKLARAIEMAFEMFQDTRIGANYVAGICEEA
jgi:hypothetical protein